MAKRFTDTDIWDKQWFYDLKPRLKCLVKYVRDKCDVSGVWSPNWALASSCVGDRVNLADLLKIDNGNQFEKLEDGKIFCAGFIQFQYGTLTEDCRPHRKIIATLKKHGLYERVLEGYCKGINTHKEEDKDKEEEGDKEEDQEQDKENAPRKSKVPTLFIDSVFFDYDQFHAKFVGTEYEVFNTRYYYEAVLNWSNGKAAKKVDWVATARNFMLKDVQDKKAVYDSNSTNGRFKKNEQTTTNNKNTGITYLDEDIARNLERLTGNGNNV